MDRNTLSIAATSFEPAALPCSLIITSRNEGPSLRRTVDDVLSHERQDALEIVIVDDASEDGSADFALEPGYNARNVRLHRSERRLGLIEGRATGADVARGERLVFLDAHCAVPPGWLDGLGRTLDAMGGEGVVVPAIHKLRPGDWSIDLDEPGAEACTVSSPFLDFAWTEPRAMDGFAATCTIGGGAWMTSRAWYDRIGGLDRGLRTWGGENIDFPLRTWAAGGRCVVARNVRLGHLFNENALPLMAEEDYLYNKMRVAHNALERGLFLRVMEALRHFQGYREALARIHEDRAELARMKERIEALRVRSDEWLSETFRLPLREPAAYYFAPRRQPDGLTRPPRPAVTVSFIARSDADLEHVREGLLERTTYGNHDVLLLVEEGSAAAERLRSSPLRTHPRVKPLSAPAPLSESAALRLALHRAEGEALVFLPEGARILEESWIEDFLLLAERRPRLLLAFPRTVLLDEGGAPAGEEVFDLEWDWSAPGFTREVTRAPSGATPFQALAPPRTALFIRRSRAIELGGLDPTGPEGPPSLTELCVAGWLAGLETICHPGIRMGMPRTRLRQDPPGAEERASRSYGGAIAALNCFVSPERIRRARERSGDAAALIRKHAHGIEARRRLRLARARHDDDWLFLKFPEDPGAPRAAPAARVSIELELALSLDGTAAGLEAIEAALLAAGGAVLARSGPSAGHGPIEHFLCERPEEAAEALSRKGERVRIAPALAVRGPRDPDAIRGILDTLRSEGVWIERVYGGRDGGILAVAVDRSPRAEDIVRALIQREVPCPTCAPPARAAPRRTMGSQAQAGSS